MARARKLPAAQSAPHVAKALEYARAVIAGEIPAGKWTILACKRHLNDLEKSTGPWPYQFSDLAAEKICTFVELCPHVEGDWDGPTIVLEPWQCFLLCVAFGWLRKVDGRRRFRRAFTLVARKNGKSTLSAAVALFLSFVDGEPGAQGHCVAVSKDQSDAVFEPAKEMVKKSAYIREKYGLETKQYTIEQPETSSYLDSLASQTDSLDGKNTHVGIVDELHAHKSDRTYRVIKSSTGARKQPMLWTITTAGFDSAGICWTVRKDLMQVLAGEAVDDAFFGIIYELDSGDDWKEPKNWVKSNPNMGVSVIEDSFRTEFEEAERLPESKIEFQVKRLNLWQNATGQYLDMQAWDKCAIPDLSEEEFQGEPCWFGLDVASSQDICAFARLYRREIDGHDHFYLFVTSRMPEAALGQHASFPAWAEQELLTVTPGNILDFSALEAEIVERAGAASPIACGYDEKWQGIHLAQRLMDAGVPMVVVPQTVAGLSQPMKELGSLIVSGRLHHNGSPCLRWQASNLVARFDFNGNIFPQKTDGKRSRKIDAMAATIDALHCAVLGGEEQGSYMDHEEVLVV